ncbi:MAG TPA: hypothetical protein V6D22_17105 [Candidatus Obscuribacterales bacterium]
MQVEPVKYYKVLMNGTSFHGGAMPYSLPIQKEDGTWKPGKWHNVDGQILLCRNALHVTSDPINWFASGAEVFEVETNGEIVRRNEKDDKIGCEWVRLIRKLTPEELAEHRIFMVGRHSITEGDATADGNATVRADGNTTVNTHRTWYPNESKVTVTGNAVHIDRRGGKPEIHVAASQS